MTRKFVDLSIFLENDVISDPPAFAPKIEYFTHDNTYQQIEPFFPGLKKEDLPDGEGWAVEFVQLSTHNGTHLDAPYHFHSTMDNALGEKKPAIAIRSQEGSAIVHSANPKLIVIASIVKSLIDKTSIATLTILNAAPSNITLLLHQS